MLAAEKIHSNLGMSKFKQIVATLGQVRFIICTQGKIHVGAAEWFIHGDIAKDVLNDNVVVGVISGYAASRKDGKIQFRIAYQNGENYQDKYRGITHPTIDKMIEHGMIRARKHLSFEW